MLSGLDTVAAPSVLTRQCWGRAMYTKLRAAELLGACSHPQCTEVRLPERSWVLRTNNTDVPDKGHATKNRPSSVGQVAWKTRLQG